MSLTMGEARVPIKAAPILSGNIKGEATALASDEVEGLATSERKGTLSNVNTPHSTVADGPRPTKSTIPSNPNFGGPTIAKATGAFPAIGSTLGPYFSVGKLGKGTFCSIHKCINMHYHHDDSGIIAKDPVSGKERPKVRLAAAKVEIGEFRNSGVLLGEATMLQFLDASLPPKTVPVYMGHFRGGEDISAIVMEYLPGQDMHWIRDWATKYKSRRISVEDAVYLTATVMLPLLQRMHEVGIVHRDVKPSNCVKRGLRDFCMVDFGLSKSIVVPSESNLSDKHHSWTGKDWIRPPHYSGMGCLRKERPTADFRGTSMYASVRVHQLRDYCPRDDMWSLLYVFCDLVSGGLPWMSYAANREREKCQKLKERIHGEEAGTPDQTERLLWGHEYHMALFKKYKGEIDPPADVDNSFPLPERLSLSKDAKKVALLREAFKHLGGLAFSDKPDYDLIKRCLEGFLDEENSDDSITPIDWERLADSTSRKRKAKVMMGEGIPTWALDETEDPADSALFQEAEALSSENEVKLTGEAADMARLPLELQYRIAQMEYNALHHSTIRPHLALRDWLEAALPLLYGEWNSQKFERGGHRSNDDGYRREFYLKLINKCIKCAMKFQNFRQLDCIYCDPIKEEHGGNLNRKKRKISTTMKKPSAGSVGTDLLAISQVAFRLRAEKRREEKKTFAPPPRLSFG